MKKIHSRQSTYRKIRPRGAPRRKKGESNYYDVMFCGREEAAFAGPFTPESEVTCLKCLRALRNMEHELWVRLNAAKEELGDRMNELTKQLNAELLRRKEESE